MYSPSSCFGCWPEPTIESIRSSATRTTPTPSDSSVCRQTSGFFILKIQKVQETAVTGRARWVFRQPPKQIQPYDYALSKAGRRLVVVSNRLYLSATGVMFGNPSGLCPVPNFVPRSVTLRGRDPGMFPSAPRSSGRDRPRLEKSFGPYLRVHTHPPTSSPRIQP